VWGANDPRSPGLGARRNLDATFSGAWLDTLGARPGSLGMRNARGRGACGSALRLASEAREAGLSESRFLPPQLPRLSPSRRIPSWNPSPGVGRRGAVARIGDRSRGRILTRGDELCDPAR
jgi:hypothetical protein